MKIKDVIKALGRRDAEYVLQKILGVDKIFLYLNPTFEITSNKIQEIINLRQNGYPLEYIFNEVYFYAKKFFIKEGVLIPRDDTEILVDVALKELRYYVKHKNKLPVIVEIGVGSGVLSILLSQNLDAKIIATDINPIAIEVAKINAKNHKVDLELYLTSLLDGVKEEVDIIVSNPPYVEEDWENDDLRYEPKEAIFAKDDGLCLLKQIIKEGLKRKAKMIICEMGYNQKEAMNSFFQKMGIKNYYFYKDLSKNYRGFVIKTKFYE